MEGPLLAFDTRPLWWWCHIQCSPQQGPEYKASCGYLQVLETGKHSLHPSSWFPRRTDHCATKGSSLPAEAFGGPNPPAFWGGVSNPGMGDQLLSLCPFLLVITAMTFLANCPQISCLKRRAFSKDTILAGSEQRPREQEGNLHSSLSGYLV